MNNKALDEVEESILNEVNVHKNKLSKAGVRLVEYGITAWMGDDIKGFLLLKCQANLLEDISIVEDVLRIKNLFHMLEAKENIANLIDLTNSAYEVQIL